jgi:RNA recognition motif-containing protein
MNSKLYAGNLSPSTTEEDLRWLFNTKGKVVSVELIRDKETGKSKGFAFVEMITTADAGKAVSEFNGYMLHDRRMKVSVSTTRPNTNNGRRRQNAGYVEYESYNKSIRNS